ncbi:MAG: TetR/AcrR family transcriptional regulator [Sandaracinus sp.]|nr:TetR/AcrR family transcriptional regulator [Myxococcales bacterium]MCB9600323.1 TetR/AcrR family transcriptional regulator [Sandaracinus sp.]MCB9613095.1 TetR/AcrR family transcriptional regulator [Sandaracinus sp.]MCB9624644.1 TetR/AcrR family transcriptional regulator [Sandaracinus sp.]MCB9632775.1 TetR/AcrR family transcriptional regulator [Sandaracinus sp.]
MTKLEREPGLRERKQARTKLALLDAFVEALGERSLEAIAVRDLCATVPVSEATFFNYFRGKADLVTYFVQLWSLDHAWHARRTLEREGALAAIGEIFARTAETVREHPRVLAEVIAAQARLEGPPEVHEIGLAERRERFAELDGIEELPARGLDSLLPWLLDEAIARGELRPDAPRDLLFLTLAAVFFGTPVALLRGSPAAVGDAWRAQLALLLGPHRVTSAAAPTATKATATKATTTKAAATKATATNAESRTKPRKTSRSDKARKTPEKKR